jgi:glycosyltransferase 2 family protein
LPKSRLILAIIAVGAVAGLLAWRVQGSGFDWPKFWATFTGLHRGWLAAGVALVFATYIGRALRWRVMMRPFAPHARFGKLLSATVIGFTGMLLLGRPGELIRPYLIAVRERTAFSSQMAIWLLERIWDLLTLLAVFGFGLTQVQVDPANLGPGLRWLLQTGGVVIAGLCSVLIVMLLMIGIFSEAAQRRIRDAMPVIPERFRGRVEGVLTAFAGGMKSSRSASATVQIFIYSVLEWLVIVAATYCLLRSFPQTSGFSWVDSAVFIGFAGLGSVVQIPGIGGGMQVASVVVLTELFGLDLASATGAAILIWAANYLFVAPVGLALAVHDGLKWRDLRHLDAEKLG